MIIPDKLFTEFNDVKFYDEPHKYFYDGKELISVTTLIHQYQTPFDEEYWSEIKAEQFGINKYEVKRLWKFINEKGTMKGSLIHNYAENLFQNKKNEYPKELVLKKFGFDPIYDEYIKTKVMVDNFYKDTLNKLIPIKCEYVVYDKELLIGGMLDKLFFNVKTNEFQIWDYKTNKNLTFSNERYKLKGLLCDLDDCDIEIYSLQLDLYKYIIEKYTGIKLGKSYLVWVSHNNDNYKIIETYDRRKYVELMLLNR
jgi:hypothetical protein